MALNLSTFCMNAGLDSAHDVLIHNIANYAMNFDSVFICDGNLTDKAKEFYSKLPKNVHVFDKPWNDSYVERYRHNASQAEENSWVLHLDSDEIPSLELSLFLKMHLKEFDQKGCEMIKLPCILHIKEGNKFYPVEPFPKEEYCGQWTKNILYKKNANLDFRHFGSHVIGFHHGSDKSSYAPFPYYHMKDLNSFIFNDVWQAFLNPGGQHYTQLEAAVFKSLTFQFKSGKDFKKATEEGAWPLPLQKFAYDRRKEFNRPISRLSWVYYILYSNKCPFGTFDLTWSDVRQHVLSKESMQLLDTNVQKKNYLKLI